MRIIILVLFFITAFFPHAALAAEAEQTVIFTPTVNGFSRSTEILTNHQGDHLIDRCSVVLDGEDLIIYFPMNPAYHLQLEFLVKGKEVKSWLDWQPVSPERVENRILAQKLYLGSEEYGLGDELHGYLELEFSSRTVDPVGGETAYYYLKGPFWGIVRPAGFDPLLDSNIATYTQTVAETELLMLNDAYTLQRVEKGDSWLAEHLDGYDLGWPAECYNNQLKTVRDDFLKSDALKKEPDKRMLHELTWDINPSAPFGDGPERLTIWFFERNGEWVQIGFEKWLYSYCPE